MSDAAQKADQTRRLVNLIAEALDEAPDARTHVTEVAAHVLAVLSETHEVVELPEPGRNVDDEPYWMGERHDVTVLDGLVEVDVSRVAPDEAKELAAGILAAARVAEVTR